MRIARCTVLALLALSAAGGAHAQSAAVGWPDSGARVRILRAGGYGWQVGTLVERAGDTLVVARPSCCARDTIGLGALYALDVSRGRGVSANRVFAGMVIGAIVGATGGYFVSGIGCETGSEGPPCELGQVIVGALAGASGLVLGGVIGAMLRVERWDPVYPPPRAGLLVRPSPTGRGVAVGVTIPARGP